MPLDTNDFYEVEVNETNIDRYNMQERFNQDRAELLSRAAEASEEGFLLSVKIPKAEVEGFNVFENVKDEHVDANRIKHCGYERRELEDGGHLYVCLVHGKTSNYDVENRPTAPCIQVDPDVKPTQEQFDELRSCRYKPQLDGRRGTIHVCLIHNMESKHDISKFPTNPCLSVDPLTDWEREHAS